MQNIDCRGLACPAPVLQTKELIEKEHPEILKIIIDNEAAKQNVSRFLESQRFEVMVVQEGTDFHVIGKGRDQDPATDTPLTEELETGKRRSWSWWPQTKWGVVTMNWGPNSWSIF